MKSIFKNFLIFLLILIVIAGIFSTFNETKNPPEEIGFGQLVAEIDDEAVQKITVKDSKLEIELKDGREQITKKEQSESLSEVLSNYEVETEKIRAIEIEIKSEEGLSFWLLNILPFLLPILLFGGLIYIMLRQVQGANGKAMSFGQSRARELELKGKKKITFKDVAGAKEAKEELLEIVEFLKHPKKFTDLGAKIPRGALLMGSPGTGKTLLAKAIAGQAGVPFFTISGSEFVEMFVGVGASRVRDLFKKAKKAAPCIIFIDEIDAVGRQRGAGLGGSHDEREQTLNQILVEMDGMESETNIIVVAATNRPDVLDPALLRPGRFDRRIVIDMPDIKAREEILNVHAKGKPLEKDVDLKNVAERTPGFSGADLANLLNEAAIITARKDRKHIAQRDILDSIEKVLLGPERRSHIVTDKEKKITAYHEAGHAICAHMLPGTDPVQKISIISRGRAAGYTLKVPIEDRMFQSYSEFLNELIVLLGGTTAEKIIYGESTTGASSDLEKATQIARNIITRYGMNKKLGPRTFGKADDMIFLGKSLHESRDYSEHYAEIIDSEIEVLIKEASVKATELLEKHKDKLEAVTEELMEKETIEAGVFKKIVGKKK